MSAQKLTDEGRYAEAADALEAELAVAPPEAAVPRHKALGRLWQDKLGRLDRALDHWLPAWHAGDEEAFEAARAIYMSLGDDDTLVKLLTDELERAKGDRRARLLLDLGRVHARRGDDAAAARALDESLALRPDDEKKRLLVEVAPARRIELLRDLAEGRRRAGDAEGAIAFLKRALPDAGASAALEAIYQAEKRWRDLVALWEGDPAALRRRAEVLRAELGDAEGAKRAYEALHARTGEGVPELRALYAEGKDWTKLLKLVDDGMAALPPERRASELLVAATIAREQLSDRDRAADYLHRVLSDNPGNAEALARYAEHFREKRDWRGLTELSEFAADTAAATGAPREELVKRLEDLAQTAELRLGDVERALGAWRRVLELDPESAKAREALRRLESRAKMWESLIAVLEKEAQAAQTPGDRAEALKRIAQVYRERQVDPRRAVALYVEALKLVPGDPQALKALVELYEREGDDAGVARTLRAQLETAERSAVRPSELPAAQRSERLTTLRRLANMYETRLHDVEGVVYASTAILETLPGDRDAMDRLERVLEHSGDAERLEQTLAYRAEAATGPAERGRALRRLAKLASGRDALTAMERWEAVLRAAPNDPEALAALARLYEDAGRLPELAQVLERQIVAARPARAEDLRRWARVLEKLIEASPDKAARRAVTRGDDDAARAHKAWQKIVELVPGDLEALEALARRYEAQGNWRDLADVLGRLAAALKPVAHLAAADALLRRARLLEERLGAPRDAAAALEELIATADPRHLDAHRRLRRLYEAAGDAERAVRVAEREILLSADPDDMTACGLDIVALCRDRLGDPHRAIQAVQRVLALAPDRVDALAQAAELYARASDWRRHVAALERLADKAAESERQAYLLRIARVVEERIGDAYGAFRWYREAHRLAPSDATLDELRRAAERSDLWVSLAEVLEEERRVARGDRFVALCRELALLSERRLADPMRAIGVLAEAVAAAPGDDSLLAEAERIAPEGGPEAWRQVSLILEGVRRVRPDARVALTRRRARLLDERLGDAAGALDELLLAFHIAPSPEARDEILRLAERTDRWADAVQVEEVLLQRERTDAGKVAAAVRSAEIVEDKLGDRVRAFRGRLRALRLAPDDEQVTMHLWRLARLIGNYAEADQSPEPPPEPAMFPGVRNAPAGSWPARARDDATIPLSLEDLMPVARERPDSTIEITAEDLRAAGVLPPPIPRSAVRRVPGVTAAPPEPRPRARRFASAWEELAFALETLPAGDAAGRRQNLFRAAEVWERGAADMTRAFETLERALVLAPDEPEPRERLYRLAEDHDEWDRLAALFEKIGDRAGRADEAAAWLAEVAGIRARQGRPRDAEALHRRILGMQPTDATARERLETIFRAEERWVDLAASLEERSDPRLGGTTPEAERPELLRELAEIYEHRLHKPYEAIGGLERLCALVPDDDNAVERMAAVYERVGRWAKVVEALARLADLVEGTPRAREARRRVGEIYEKELELPERAMEVYQSIVSVWPDDEPAYRALDPLLAEAERWPELAEVLRRRAALAPEAPERGALLRRRAAVLSRLDRADEAIACLRHARGIFPRDEELADDLVAALLGVGAAREAAEVLEQRVAALEKEAGAPGDAAALLVRLGAVYTDLEDADSARRCLEKALQRVPDHPSALAALSRLALGLDPRAYAEARLREAAAAKDVGAKVAAYLSAGATLQGRVGDADAARRAFQAALELEPANAEAIWALSALAPSQAEAEALLERRLAEDLPGEERARVLTELAALAQRAGVHAMAGKRLEEALAACPDHVPAVVARADLLRAEGAFAELEAFLREALPRLDAAPPAVRAELYRRAAEACERLGRDDDAYVLLNEADRLLRGELRTKLALGENRFRARRWREAALHLSALGDHPDALSRAGEVAAGLTHAAVAETRALRPDRAPALYEAAIRFDPDHTPALHALAEIAVEKGDVAGAADLLERQADATVDPAERVRLYEALGDLAVRALSDLARARACYEQAVASASPLEAKHVPLLHKLRVSQRDAADAAGAGRTCELLSSFSADARTRGAFLLETAELYATAGDAARARTAAARAVEADPQNETALHLATELDLALADPEAAASRLGRALPGLPPPDEADAPRRAELWRRLGEARRARGDVKGAVPAYDKAVATAPDCDAADAARARLVELLGADNATGHLRALAVRAARPADLLALGRALVASSVDGAHVALTLAGALGEALSAEDRAFLAAHPPRRMAPDETYAAALDDADVALLGDGADGPLVELGAALGEAAALLWPDPVKAVGDAARRLGAGRAAAIFHQVAKVVAPPTVLFAAEAAGAPDVTVVCASPPAVVLGPRLLGDAVSDLELRFVLSRAAFLTRAARLPGAGLPPERLALLAQALATFGGARAATPEVEAEAQSLRRTLPLRVRLRVEALAHAPLEPDRYRAACERAADRAGLLLAGDVAAAARATHLVRFAASEAFLALRSKIGLKVV